MKKTARLSKNVWLKRLKLESKIHYIYIYIYKANVRHGICLIFLQHPDMLPDREKTRREGKHYYIVDRLLLEKTL